MDPLLAISFESFSSVWYWIMTGIAWSMTCHFTLGVPYDALVRAHQRGGVAAEQAEQLAKLQVARITAALGSFGPLLAAVIGFVLAIVATLGFAYDLELAQAAFMLAAPLILVQALQVRLAFRIAEENVEGANLRALLVRRRFWNQVIGLSAIALAAAAAFLSFTRHVVIWY